MKTTTKIIRAELERFIERLDAYETRLLENPDCYQLKERGALRRASMDLSRALVDIRRTK